MHLTNMLRTSSSNHTRKPRTVAWLLILIGFVSVVWNWFALARDSEVIFYPAVRFANALTFPLIGIAVVCTLAAFTVKPFRAVSTLSKLILVVCTLFSALLLFFGASHVTSAKFGNSIYHIARRQDDNGTWEYALCACERSGVLCKCDWFCQTYTYNAAPANLQFDQTASELTVNIGGKTVFKQNSVEGYYIGNWEDCLHSGQREAIQFGE